MSVKITTFAKPGAVTIGAQAVIPSDEDPAVIEYFLEHLAKQWGDAPLPALVAKWAYDCRDVRTDHLTTPTGFAHYSKNSR